MLMQSRDGELIPGTRIEAGSPYCVMDEISPAVLCSVNYWLKNDLPSSYHVQSKPVDDTALYK